MPLRCTVLLGDVDLCLVPEVAIELEGENGCLPFLKQRVAEQGHAVVVVAEGESECAEKSLSGTTPIHCRIFPLEGAGEELLGQSMQVDASGNRKLPAIGVSLLATPKLLCRHPRLFPFLSYLLVPSFILPFPFFSFILLHLHLPLSPYCITTSFT
jgi:hypothetical protein